MQRHNPHLPNEPVKRRGGGMTLDGKHFADTLSCVHCSANWVPQPGSRKQRGYCTNCQGFLCGQADCVDSCLPLELNLQKMERGISKNQALKEYDALPRNFILGATDLGHS